MSCKPEWWPEDVIWRNPNNKSAAGPKMKSAELALVLSSYKDFRELALEANAGRLLNEGQADGNMFAYAAAESDLSEDEMALMKKMLKEEVEV